MKFDMKQGLTAELRWVLIDLELRDSAASTHSVARRGLTADSCYLTKLYPRSQVTLDCKKKKKANLPWTREFSSKHTHGRAARRVDDPPGRLIKAAPRPRSRTRPRAQCLNDGLVTHRGDKLPVL
ncbi:hypothetical protein EVAR_23070_1 [Eumeta japonica]|uniref:Uncharacterized protein n=1 Tax=Eumeta variegata TaxID=151549 RepID=A0A4C1VPR0_EUMVA|nr:hypothetical protein EVAR_23070_1 [Eumeta japonica]